jgi:tetratricopeptide (TPR) repeat protein
MYEQARADAVLHGDATQRGSAALQLGLIENEEGNAAKARVWLKLAGAELPPEATIERATALDSGGFAADLAGDKDAAIALRREAIAAMQREFPHGHPLITTMSVNLANALQKNGQFDDAIDILDGVLPVQIETLGEFHSDIVWTLTTLTSIERKRGRLDAALGYARRAYETSQHLSDDNDWKAYAFEKYGDVLIASGHAQEALPILQKALVIDQAMLPADHQSIASVESLLALAQSRVDGHPSGEPMAQAAYERLLAKYGAGSDFTIAAKSRLEQIRALAAAPPAAR